MTNQSHFLLEKYKYILTRKQSLNEATFKITAIYQTLIAALCAAEYGIINQLAEKKITLEAAILATYTTFGLLTILTFFILALLIGGILSWLKYRKDESEIELATLKTTKTPVKAKDIFRWYETYIALAVTVIYVLASWSVPQYLIPFIRELKIY